MFSADEDSLRSLIQSAEYSGFEIFEGEDAKGRNPVADLYYDYWLDKCRGDRLPGRQDIRPEELRGYLPHSVLMDLREEASAYQDFRLIVRLIGTHVVEAYGELTGLDIADMDNAAAAERIYRMSALARDQRLPVLSRVLGFAPGREHMEAYALYMPLSDSGEAVERIFVAVDVGVAREGQ